MAFALMQDPPADQFTTELLESVAAGRAQWDETRLGPILDANRNAIQMMQRGTALPECDWGLDYDLGPATPIAHLAKARVMARLNTLAGMRLAARGQISQAIETWLTGVRFAQHLGQRSSLISLLTARLAFGANLYALTETVSGVQITDEQRSRILAAMSAMPDTGFDWGNAIQYEQLGLEIFVQQLSVAPNPGAYYQNTMGTALPDGFSLPSSSNLAAFRQFLARATNTLRLPPDVAREQLKDLEATQRTLHPILRNIPSLSKINDVRVEVRAERQRLLEILSAQRN
jgi:hypothetical protein